MVAYKASQVARFLKSPGAGIAAALFYGPDESLVAERAQAFACDLAARSDPPGEVIVLDEQDLAADPDRLAVEACTHSMFAPSRVLRVRPGRRPEPETLGALLAGPLEAFVIVEAGNLRPSSPLRKVFEEASNAAALPCYADAGGGLRALIRETLAGLGVRPGEGVLADLQDRLGGDQAAIRQELAKLALYVGEGGTASLADVDAVIGDLSQAALDTLSLAATGGDARSALRQLDRLLASGQSPQGALSAIGRHLQRLHRIGGALESGATLREALDGIRPKPHFRVRDALETQARGWPRERTAGAIALANDAIRQARRQPELERALAERLLLALAERPS